MNKPLPNTEEIYLAGGCLWGVQEFCASSTGAISTEAGRAMAQQTRPIRNMMDTQNASAPYLPHLKYPYPAWLNISLKLSTHTASTNRGLISVKNTAPVCISKKEAHLNEVRQWIASRKDSDRIAVEVLPLSNYIPSDPEHQDRLTRCPEDSCHLPQSLLHKYK